MTASKPTGECRTADSKPFCLNHNLPLTNCYAFNRGLLYENAALLRERDELRADLVKLDRAADLLRQGANWPFGPVFARWKEEVYAFLASLSSRSSAGNGYDGRGKTVAAGPHRPGNKARTPGGAEDASAEGGRE